MPTYKLIYFDFRGLGEPIRFMLSYMGAEFEDYRFKREQWPRIKKSVPFAKVPILEIDGVPICQSAAICRFLAKEAGLDGKNESENLQIDMAVDSFSDFRLELVKAFEKDEVKKAEIMQRLMDEIIPLYMGRFNEQIKTNGGYFCNGALSWADLYIVALIDSLYKIVGMDFVSGKYEYIEALRDKVLAIPSIKQWVDKRPFSIF